MNIFKIGLALLTAAGFGFGADKLADTEIFPMNQDTGYGHMYDEDYRQGSGYCHGDEDFLDHMLDDLSDEDLILVEIKIDELLVKYSITQGELHDNYDIRYDFMTDLMEFLDENEIDYHNHGFYDDHEDDGWHGGMGMH